MSDDMARLRDEVAGVLGEHQRAEQFTKPSRRNGLTEWGARCVCGVEMPWAQADRTTAHQAHLADALLPLLARVRDEGIEAGVDSTWHLKELKRRWLAEGEARVRAQVESLIVPVEDGGPTDDEPLTVGDLRAALATGDQS